MKNLGFLIQLDGVLSNEKPDNWKINRVEKLVDDYHEVKDRNLASEVKNWISVTNRDFFVTDLQKDLDIVTKRDKENARQIIKRLKDQSFIEPSGNRHNQYRRVESELIKIDWKGALVHPLSLDWPLGLDDLFTCYRKNIMCFAGTPDAGKTAFFFDFIKRNQNKYKIHLFNSEMSAEEMKLRLSKHDDMKLEDWNFNAYERSSNFADVIKPDDVNVIDYIDLNENTYQIGAYIREIHEKLNKGICLIGLQKPFGRDMGYGKEFGMKIPRLYMSIEGGIAKILKCKNRKTEDSPAGKILKYKLVGGWKFMPRGVWCHPEDEKLALRSFG